MASAKRTATEGTVRSIVVNFDGKKASEATVVAFLQEAVKRRKR